MSCGNSQLSAGLKLVLLWSPGGIPKVPVTRQDFYREPSGQLKGREGPGLLMMSDLLSGGKAGHSRSFAHGHTQASAPLLHCDQEV